MAATPPEQCWSGSPKPPQTRQAAASQALRFLSYSAGAGQARKYGLAEVTLLPMSSLKGEGKLHSTVPTTGYAFKVLSLFRRKELKLHHKDGYAKVARLVLGQVEGTTGISLPIRLTALHRPTGPGGPARYLSKFLLFSLQRALAPMVALDGIAVHPPSPWPLADAPRSLHLFAKHSIAKRRLSG